MNSFSGSSRLNEPEKDKDSFFPVHPGAAAYFSDNEKSFLDQYGDWFYLSSMILGAIGSIYASYISTVRAKEGRANLSVLIQLEKIRENVMNCTDFKSLSENERLLEKIVNSSLRNARDGKFEASGLQALQISLRQTQLAISDKKQKIVS